MNLLDRLSIPADVMTRRVGEETVILDLASGTYFGLDPVGTRIWSLVEDGRSLAEICDAMLESHEVSRGEIERDVLALAESLRERGLVQVR